MSPDLVCISVTKSPISAICSGVAWMTRSGPSAIDVELSSVISVAISMMT